MAKFDEEMQVFLSAKVKVFSFDIFDTVLTRETATPGGIFALVQQRIGKQTRYIIPSELVRNFCAIRPQAEKEAQKHTKKESVTMRDIYGALARKFQLPNDISNFLMNLEIGQELDSVRPIPKIIRILDFLHRQKVRIVFISDMYLPKGIIQRLLKKVGAYKEGDGIYLSNEFSVTKKSRRLFKHVLKAEDCPPSKMIHIGDNFTSDITPARHIGIKSIHFKDSELNRYEKAMLHTEQKVSSSSGYIWGLLAGASRLARLNSYRETGSNHALRCLGANVAGPILLGYVMWILQEAQKYGIRRLYFCARDGQILLEIAKKMVKLLELNIDLRYLYISRQAVYLPAATELGSREIEWLLRKDRPLSIRVIAYRAGIKPEIIQQGLHQYLGERIEIDQIFEPEEFEKLRSALLDNKLSSLILANARKLKMSAFNYFEQEGLMDDVTWGLVDTGWQGRTQDSLKKILDTAGRCKHKIYSFYFGLLCPAKSRSINGNVKNAFFFDLDYPSQLSKVEYQTTLLMEIFTTADHGLTLFYDKDKNNMWRPKLKEPRNKSALEWGLGHFRRGVYQFLDHLGPSVPKHLISQAGHCSAFITPLTKLLLLSPLREEAEAIGDYLYYSGITEIDTMHFAPAFSALKALRYGFDSNHRRENYLTFWLAGSRSRSNLISRLILSHKSQARLGKAGWLFRGIIKRLHHGRRVTNKKKILFISHTASMYGAERSLLRLLQRLDKSKYEPLVILPCEGPLKYEIDNIGLKTVVYPIERWIAFRSEYSRWHFKKLIAGLPARISFLCRLIDAEKIDLVYTNTITSIDGALASKIKRLPHIWHIREILHGETSLKPYIPIAAVNALVHMFSSRIIVVSTAVKKGISPNRNRLGNNKIRVIYNGFEIEKFKKRRFPDTECDLRLELKLDKETKIIASIGTLMEKKGQSDLIEAAQIVTSRFANVKFLLVGGADKDFLNKLRVMTKKFNLRDKIYFLDFRKNLLPVYHSMDMLVSAARIEPLGGSIIEAMASGKPVIATRTGGSEEIVLEGQTGLLVPPRSPGNMARAIIRMLSDSESSTRMGKLGQQRASQSFDIKTYVSNIQKTIDEVLTRSKACQK